ncbi:MAG: hypothetical protein ACT4PP_08695 [Sporichthyaceae bacterium]
MPVAPVAELLARLPPGVVRTASGGVIAPPVLPVLDVLRPLFRGGGLRRGSTVEVGVDTGGAALLLTVLAGASLTGSWCALVGAPRIGLVAAAETGIALSRLALIPAPGKEWARAAGALLDGFDVVAVQAPGDLTAATARSLSARARGQGAVLVSFGPWPGADQRLASAAARWEGLGDGFGRLRARRMLVQCTGRGSAGGGVRRAEFWLPGTAGAPVEIATVSDASERGTSEERERTESLSRLPSGSRPELLGA